MNKKGKHVTPSKTSSTATSNKQADILLIQMRMEQAVKDLAKSNRQKGIIAPKSLTVSSTSEAAPITTSQTTKNNSKKK